MCIRDRPEDLALHQPLAHFALAALELVDTDSPTRALDVISVLASVLDNPMPALLQQRWVARGAAGADMKADGVEDEARMEALDEITWPKPLADLLEPAYEA